MKTPSASAPFFFQAARILKLTGTILILISLVNMLLLVIPPSFGQVGWWLELTTGMAERGILPILGMALIYAGFGFEQFAGASEKKLKPLLDLKNWVYVIAGFLGIIFLLLIPLHVMQTLNASQEAIARVETETERERGQIELRLQLQQRELANILADEARVEEFVVSNELTEEQLERLRQLENNPEGIERQVSSIKASLMQSLDARVRQAKERSRLGVLKSIARFGVTSVLLASCYLSIAWAGLRQGKRKNPRRPLP